MFFLLFFVGIGAALWLIHIYQPNLLEAFQNGTFLTDYEQPEFTDVRGTVYDRNYKELGVSYERVSIYANIREITDLQKVAEELAVVLGESEKTIHDRLNGNTLRLWLARDISQQQEELIRELGLPGVSFHKEYVRYYPYKESGAHFIGFVENNGGLSGIEYLLDQLRIRYRLKRRKINDLERIAEGRPGTDGDHLVLTLDLKIQKALDRFLENSGPIAANGQMGILVMEATTGAIVGYAQRPSFDPNNFHTFSPVVFNDIFDSTIVVPEPFRLFLRDISLIQNEADGRTDPLPWSVAAEKRDRAVSLQLWETLGALTDGPYDFINRRNREQAAVRVFSGQNNPLFDTVPSLMAPLQLVTAITRAVNGGKGVTPRGGDRYIVRDNQAEYLLEDLKPSLKENILKKGVSAEVRALFSSMGQDAILGSSTLTGESVSCVVGDTNRYIRHRVALSLVPADKPDLVIMMVSNEPDYRTGGRNTLDLTFAMDKLIPPVAALQQVMKNLADMVRPKVREEKNFQTGRNGVGLPAKNNDIPSLVITRMPDLTGMSLRKSFRLLRDAGVEIVFKGSGRIVSHKPKAGAALVSGSTVRLLLEPDLVDFVDGREGGHSEKKD